MGVGIQPAVAFDKADAVCGSSAQPVGLNKIRIAAHFFGVLFRFRFVVASCQHLAIRSPHIAPAVGIGFLRPFHKIQVVFIYRAILSKAVGKPFGSLPVERP